MEEFDSPFARHLKREARQLRKHNPFLKQHQALDETARQNGFENWRHFTNSEPTDLSPFISTIATSWQDDRRRYWSESIQLKHTRALKELYPRSGRRHTVWQKAWLDESGGSIFIPARLQEEYVAEGDRQRYARERVASIARYLMFLDATGLRPSFAWKTAFAGFPEPFRSQMRLPSFDHEKLWRDEEGRYLFSTEPYDERRLSGWEQLQKVAEARNYDVAMVDWLGMHNPSKSPGYGTRLILLTHRTRGVSMSEMLSKLNRLPIQYLPDQEWQGKTIQL
ncbi:hypothetical protein HNO92_002207 [Chromobacterium alkanivorans]|uniref:hypothetical protein n=1 Tax=Chromobacterium alkanivorans TaxID=1071719 RepID=UPI002168E172|nr:hypothetical protein [Chromobacterium alkanivorans]MCS3805056.1 hypothetical protein [Chromobacterium alkanivorans]MCS3819381.1 hypothetical protein [Chromobacterium alkanivorans]MCS3873893.1 hypothetical protein [Chromobacterium alkanivorans]